MWQDLQDNPKVFAAGFVLGAVILLVLVLIFKYVYAELFTDPNSLDPITKSLLTYHYDVDPMNSANAARRTMMPMVRKETFNPATPILVSKLWQS